jgi:hypothetical protein
MINCWRGIQQTHLLVYRLANNGDIVRQTPIRVKMKGCHQVSPHHRARESVPQGHLKVAHYEVVGNGVKDTPSPKGRSNPQSLARIRPRERKQPIDRPLRDGSLLKERDPPLRSGLLSNVPPGRGPLRMLLSLRSTRMGGCRIGYVSIQICSFVRALPAAHFDRNATIPVTDLVH